MTFDDGSRGLQNVLLAHSATLSSTNNGSKLGEGVIGGV